MGSGYRRPLGLHLGLEKSPKAKGGRRVSSCPGAGEREREKTGLDSSPPLEYFVAPGLGSTRAYIKQKKVGGGSASPHMGSVMH